MSLHEELLCRPSQVQTQPSSSQQPYPAHRPGSITALVAEVLEPEAVRQHRLLGQSGGTARGQALRLLER